MLAGKRSKKCVKRENTLCNILNRWLSLLRNKKMVNVYGALKMSHFPRFGKLGLGAVAAAASTCVSFPGIFLDFYSNKLTLIAFVRGADEPERLTERAGVQSRKKRIS